MKQFIAAVAARRTCWCRHCGGRQAADRRHPTIKVGDMAPDFTLTDQNGNKVSLHDFKGKKNVALAFYIFAFTGG